MTDALLPLTAPVSVEEEAVGRLITQAHLATDSDLPQLFDEYAAALGVTGLVTYVADLQQRFLHPFARWEQRPRQRHRAPVSIDGTLPGRAFQLVQTLTHELSPASDGVRVWVPLLDGAERLGVLGVTVPDQHSLDVNDGALTARLLRFAGLVAELIMTKTMYGDRLVRLRRAEDMGLAAELQWSNLPPLTFASHELTVAGGLEPAYHVAGDTLDYSVDRHLARFAILDGMGHGFDSAMMAVTAVAAYRHSRRQDESLLHTVASMDAVCESHFGSGFITGHVAELTFETGEYQWVNAGHPSPLLIRGGRHVSDLRVDPRPPLGLAALNRSAAGAGRAVLEPGDIVVLFSDGVIEARSPQGEFFGAERLADLVVKNVAAGLPAPETTRRIVRELLEHQQGQLEDDATVMLVHYQPSNQAALLPG